MGNRNLVQSYKYLIHWWNISCCCSEPDITFMLCSYLPFTYCFGRLSDLRNGKSHEYIDYRVFPSLCNPRFVRINESADRVGRVRYRRRHTTARIIRTIYLRIEKRRARNKFPRGPNDSDRHLIRLKC